MSNIKFCPGADRMNGTPQLLTKQCDCGYEIEYFSTDTLITCPQCGKKWDVAASRSIAFKGE